MTRQKGDKTALVHDAIESFTGSFSVAEIQRKCPGVGIDMIRRVMKDMQTEGVIECIIRGRDAKWQKVIR
ncbi:MAG: hypothetical protein A4E62_02853 [Syntrophorhabdus sp. PtaU1.Bin002]|nr:MAG: hypothetical protein A4E62_02853 [Syntrophorhabdus sp. PtaU1.Bin002]